MIQFDPHQKTFGFLMFSEWLKGDIGKKRVNGYPFLRQFWYLANVYPFFSCLEQDFEDERNGKRKADSRSIASDHRKKVKDWGD